MGNCSMAKGMDRHMFRRAAAALRHDQSGSSAVEFALVFPVLGLLLFGIIQFSIAFHDRVVLTDGVRIAARQFAISRGQTTPLANATAYFTGSTGWSTAQAPLTLTVNGTACTDAAGPGNCATALSSAVGQPVTATATRACKLDFFGFDFSGVCTLSSQSTERVQ